jgi:hypothetical protein
MKNLLCFDGDSDRWDELKPSIVAPGSDAK